MAALAAYPENILAIPCQERTELHYTTILSGPSNAAYWAGRTAQLGCFRGLQERHLTPAIVALLRQTLTPNNAKQLMEQVRRRRVHQQQKRQEHKQHEARLRALTGI